MCVKCSAPADRYYVKDTKTGLLVCEECGFSSKNLSQKCVEQGDYIWIRNTDWPEYHSFDELFNAFKEDPDNIPGFKLYGNYPSRLFTAILELVYSQRSERDA